MTPAVLAESGWLLRNMDLLTLAGSLQRCVTGYIGVSQGSRLSYQNMDVYGT